MSTESIPIPRPSTVAPATVRTIERHILAVTAIVAIHFVLLAGAMATYSIAAASDFTSVLPKQPPLIWIAALVLAHCSSIAIWWARFPWPYHLKTVIAFLGGGCLWALLSATLTVCHYHPISAACWAAAMGIQLALTGIAVLVLDSAVYRARSATWSQFSIMYLLVWTAVVASLCGTARWLSESWGWTATEILGWEYARHLQVLAVVDCLLAICLTVGVRLNSSWYVRSIACALTICLVCAFGSLALFEQQRGPTFFDLVWLMGNQGLFLVATLIPLEIARETRT